VRSSYDMCGYSALALVGLSDPQPSHIIAASIALLRRQRNTRDRDKAEMEKGRQTGIGDLVATTDADQRDSQ